jgi:hypothetical protein
MKLDWLILLAAVGITLGQTPGPSTSPTKSPTPQGPRVGIARVSRQVQMVHGGDRNNVIDYIYRQVVTTFTGRQFVSIDQSYVYEEVFSMQAEIFFQVNDNDAILDAIKLARCAQHACTLESTVYPGMNTTRVAFKAVVSSGVNQPNNGVAYDFDSTSFQVVLLQEMNNTLQDPDFNFTIADIQAQSEEGSIYYQADVYRDVLTDPTDLKSMGFVHAVKKLVDEEMFKQFVLVAETGDSIENTEINYCVLRSTCLNCDSSTGDCLDCPIDTWGLDCEVPCTCSNGGTCGADSCLCDYPDMGLRCDLQRSCSSQCTPAGTPPSEHTCCNEDPRPEWCHEPQYNCEVNCCDVTGGPNDWCQANNCCGCVPGFNCGNAGCVPEGSGN